MLLRFAIAVSLLALPAAAAEPDDATPVELEVPLPGFSAIAAGPGLTQHEETYLLPATSSNRYEGSRTEVVFRISGKLRISGSRFFLGFTQLSFWQAYNKDESSPFRETDYRPEVFYRIVPYNSGADHWGADFGVVHESNGRSGEDSRSWNRLRVTVHRTTRHWLASLELWHRLHESRCPIGEDGMELEKCRTDAHFDDNPRIIDFMGYGQLHLRYQWIGGGDWQQLHLTTLGNLATGKGGVGLDYSHASGSEDLYWFVKAWHGYGESLIDHDRSVTRFGLGILLRR